MKIHEGSTLFTRLGYRKQKNMSDFWSKKWPRSFKKFKEWSLTREFLKQYSTEKQNGYLKSSRLREVTMRELTVLSGTNCLNLDKQTGYPTRTTLRTMTSTRLASSGCSEWGAKSRGLLKPGLGHSYLRIFIQLNNLAHPRPRLIF